MAAVGAWYAAATVAEVATVAATALSVAAAVQSSVQANANANAQEEAAEKRNEQLVEQTIANYDELADVELDAQQQANDEAFEVQKGYIQEKGRINVMAAAMGTGGMSVSSQLNDLEREKYTNYSTILQNRQAKQDNIRSQAENMRYQAASSMNVNPVSRPSFAATALSLGSTVATGYSSYQSLKKESDLVRTPTPSIKSGG